MLRVLPAIRPRFWGLLLACLLILAGGARAASGEESESAAREVKAAYLYKFLGYVEWPPSVLPQPDAPFVIAVAGADAIADTLTRMVAGRSVAGRAITVRRLRPGEGLDGVHLLYIGTVERARQAQLLAQAQQRPILTVTDNGGGSAPSGIIDFRLVDNRVRFEVSLGAAERNGLKLSARLLSVALAVHPGGAQ
jgi:hypothetical protein